MSSWVLLLREWIQYCNERAQCLCGGQWCCSKRIKNTKINTQNIHPVSNACAILYVELLVQYISEQQQRAKQKKKKNEKNRTPLRFGL